LAVPSPVPYLGSKHDLRDFLGYDLPERDWNGVAKLSHTFSP
jgi:hypothetical protein